MRRREFVAGIASQARAEGKRIWESLAGVKDRASMVKLEEQCWGLGPKVGNQAPAQALEWLEEQRGGQPCPGCTKLMQRQRSVRVYQTLVGTLRVQRWYYYCRRCGRSLAPLDEWLEGGKRLSLGVQAKLCEAGAEWGFVRAAKKLRRLAGIRVSPTAVGNYTRAWAAQAIRPSRQPQTRRLAPEEALNISIDAGKVHTKERGWRDLKIAYFYDKEQSRRHYVVGIEHVDRFGRRVRRAAAGKGVKSTQRVFVRGDGAQWVWKLADQQLPGSEQLVDFYHVAGQLGEFARVLFGEGSPLGRRWLDRQLHQLKHCGPNSVMEEVRGLQLRKRGHRQAGKRLLGYLSKRRHRMDYPGYLVRGWEIGSGPVESACKEIISLRLKRGRRWRRHHAVNIANLRGLFLSDQWDPFWQKALSA